MLNKNDENKKPDQRKKKDDEFQWKKASKTGLIWIAILFAAIIFTQFWSSDEEGSNELSFSEYQEILKADNIESGDVVMKDNVLIAKTRRTHILQRSNSKQVNIDKFKTVLPFINEEVVKEWQDKKVNIQFVSPTSDVTNILIQFIPWVLIIAVWIFIARKMQGGGGGGGSRGIFSFGKSPAKMVTQDKTKVTFADVAGADEAKQELQEIIDFLKDPSKFQKLGGKLPKGALLLGPPGTGKTLLAKAVAGEAGVPFLSMSGADFVEMFVGVGASRVRDLFETGRKHAPCIIFIDEMDAVGRHRGAGLGGGHDEREQTLNQLLVEMDGFDTKEGVILLAATNRPDVLDSALLRPGRFDRQIVVDRPDVRGREGILKVHSKNVPLAKDINMGVLARGTPGMSGADLANLVNEAALLAARRNRTKVVMEDFEDAKDKVMMGMERKTMLISDDEKKSTAYHESGHVLVAKFMPESDPVHKVTIIPRGRALGITAQLPIDEKHSYSRKYLETRLAILFGGRAAEMIVLDQTTTGAGNDIERASTLARKMICEWGMNENLGPVAFGKKEEEIFLGREITQHRDYSENTAKEIDKEVQTILNISQKRAETIINDNIDLLHSLTEALLEYEILDSVQIDTILDGKTLKAKNPKKKTPAKKQAAPKKNNNL
jgi:cell division protease FtsH